jgi:hypothetical protein
MEFVHSGQLAGAFSVVLGILFIVYLRKNRKYGASQSWVAEAYLIDMKNVTGKEEHKITKRVTTIGRMKGKNIDICIDGSTISTEHARIEFRNGGFYLTDLRSRNGTFLNKSNDRITDEVFLKDGDTITFDKHIFRFVMPKLGKQRAKDYKRTVLRTQ